LVWLAISVLMILCAIVSIGHKRGTQLGKLRQWVCAKLVGLTARFCLLMYGVVWCEKKKVHADYSKWLGPEWQFDPITSFKGASTYVSNHQSIADIFVQLYLHFPAPGYVAKDVVRKVWGVGYVAEVIL
jgi:1-acyl-sn-glycerol-3-phosphate acyltransferase